MNIEKINNKKIDWIDAKENIDDEKLAITLIIIFKQMVDTLLQTVNLQLDPSANKEGINQMDLNSSRVRTCMLFSDQRC